jgi:hypothetical protein
MPRIRDDLVARQRRDGFVTVAEASRLTDVHPRTIRTWTRRKPEMLRVRRVGPMLVFVEVASLLRATGAERPDGTDDEILAELGLTGRTTPPTTQPHDQPPALRELTLHRDEESQ